MNIFYWMKPIHIYVCRVTIKLCSIITFIIMLQISKCDGVWQVIGLVDYGRSANAIDAFIPRLLGRDKAILHHMQVHMFRSINNLYSGLQFNPKSKYFTT